MKLLVLSDNHGDEYFMDEIYSIYEKEIDAWLHCGDSEFGEIHPHWNYFTTVRGNQDISDKYSTENISQFDGIKYVQVHGHLHKVKQSFEQLKALAKENDAHLAFYGHTHIPRVDFEDNIYFINPGSVTQPKGDYEIGSYAIVEVEGTGGKVNFYDTNHNEMKELSQELHFSD